VRVPASSANLGPGFDAIGLALDLHLRADVTPAERFSVTFDPGPWAPTNPNFEHEITRGITTAASGELPRVSLRVNNAIPLGKGLGASAAGAVLGLIVARECLSDPPGEADLAQAACAIEGHPDNALPALLGGVVIAAQGEDARPAFVRIEAPPALRAVVVVPQIVLPTAAARALLPERYERRDVVYNIQRAALLAAALAGNRLDVLRVASADRVHQPYRAPLVPGFTEMLGLELPGLLCVALSGAGPSVIALVTANEAAIGAALCETFAREGVESTAFSLTISSAGAAVEALAS
jgi:homoserine kinase